MNLEQIGALARRLLTAGRVDVQFKPRHFLRLRFEIDDTCEVYCAKILMSSIPRLPRDTSPQAIERWQQVSSMSLDQAKASLLQAKASLDTLKVGPWWNKLLVQYKVPNTHPTLNIQDPVTKSVNQAVSQYDSTYERLLVDHAISLARKKAGWKMEPDIKAVLLGLFNHLEIIAPRPLPPIPNGITEVIPRQVVERINLMARYTAMNISQFENVPPPKLKTQFQNAVWAADQDASRTEGLGKQMSYAKIIGRCNKKKLDAIREVVDAGRGAVCTSFAGPAASILLMGHSARRYRVEMISGPNHCFCLVNRAPATNELRDPSGATVMPGKDFWGDSVILIDAWAGALGHPVFYSSPKDFPKVLQIYLTSKLLQHFDSEKDEL